MDENIRVKADELEKFMKAVFTRLGVDEQDAAICADVLITADRRGIDSHGIARLKTIYYDRIKDGIQETTAECKVIKETPATALIDGSNGMGHAISKKAMALAIKKSSKCGIGMTAVKNSTHYGIAGYYALQAAKENMIGITGTNARPSVAPTFSTEPMLGTNPLTIGMPTDEEFPFVLDCATSLSQRGKIEVYDRISKKVPEGWVVGEDGNAMTDAGEILAALKTGAAALAPLGGIGEETAGYKGYGYSAAVEILSAALQGGPFLKMLSGFSDGEKIPYRLGHFFIAINVGAFIGPDNFKKTAGNILRSLRSSRKAPGEEHIYTAGEKEYLAWKERKDAGIPLTNTTQKEIIQMRDELNLKGFNFPF